MPLNFLNNLKLNKFLNTLIKLIFTPNFLSLKMKNQNFELKSQCKSTSSIFLSIISYFYRYDIDKMSESIFLLDGIKIHKSYKINIKMTLL